MIDFTITEVPGKFITTPNVALRLGIKPTEEEVYLCMDCHQPVGYGAWMYIDMQKPFDGWHHFYDCPGKN